MNINELNSFNLADAVKFHRRLNPALWGADEHLLPEVQQKLLAVADDFREFLGVDDLKLVDITLSGSNAAYSYTANSDIDLHLVVEMPDDPVYRELFDAKKYQYNDTHNIRIGGADVELYVQPADQAHHSQGIYSVKNSDWLQVPQRRRAKIDDNCVQSKTADLDARIHAAIKTKNLEVIDSLWNKIKTMRQTGLEKNGEFGCENIAFKLLRNQGCIADLVAAKTAARDQELSLKTKPRERKTVNYGMRDYWYPGTAYAGQDHPAGTESEQVDESQDINRKLSWSDLDPGLSIEDKIEIFETYIIKGNLFETNDLNAKEYFLSLADMCDHLILDQKYIVVPLILINNRLMMLDQPGVMKFLGTHQHALKFESSAGEKTFPSQLMRNMSVTNTFTFSDSQTYDKFRNIMHLKYHFDLPSVAPDNQQDIKENINTDQLKKILHRFYSSCVSKLQLENPPQLRLETTPEWSQENGSFGQYDPDSNTLILATSGRHVLDILRTMAHEMTHRQQDEREPLPIDAGETGSPWEDQANAMAGRIMRDWAEEQPEMFDGVTLEEASGYIPTKKQARDPRFSMALTQDVRPGAVGKEANKLGLKTDAQGHPALLMKTTNTLAESLARELELFEEQDLFEINMGSKNLRREAAKTGALAGMEFEMIVPGTGGGDGDMEEDMDLDESTRDIDNIVRFFDDGDYNSRNEISRLHDKLYDDFREWQFEKIGEGWYEEGRDFLRDYIVNNNEFDGGEAEATAREELEQDLFYRELPEAEREQMVEKRTGEMLEEFVEEEWSGQDGSIYEAAREEYESEMQDDWTESTWLNDNGLDQMSDVLREYTITWPYYTSPESTVSINEIGDEFSDAIGRPVNASDRYHGGRREAGHYVVEPDGSLDPDSDDDQGLEFVSPPLPIDDMLSDLNKVVAWAKQKGCYTNDSTGLHINISVPGFSQEKLDFVKLAVLLGDERVLDSFGRAGNTYAKSALKIVKDNIRSNPGPAAALLTKMKTNMDSLATKAIHSGTTAKYTSINTKDGYVEFRSPGGDWLDANFSLIEPTLLRFVVALDAAIDPEKYRQEYQKKLYKLLTADNKDDSTIRYFVDYVAGKIPKAALRSFVKQAQLERGLKKNPVQEPGSSPARDPSIGPRQRYVVKNAAGSPVTTVAASDADSARILANRWLRQQNPGINTNEFSVEPETAENQIQNYHISDTQGGVVRMAFRAGSDEEALDRLEIYNYSHPQEGGYRLSREDGTTVTEPGAPAVGSTADLQQQRQAAATPRPIPGVQDIDIDIPIAPPRGNWDGQWRVVDSDTGQELYRFGGIGNSQADANRVAADWLRQNAPKDADMTQIEVYPVLSEGRTQEDYDPSNPPGPESPPQMPAGTIKVDVSDMYDWYKLGQNISDLKSIDKSTLGKGPPSTVFAFGSEDLENMYSHALTRLGLKTHDLDEPGEEDVDEQVVNELKINNASGIGAVPNNQQIGYQGLQVVMRPSMFLELALPLDAKSADERETIEYIKKNLDEKGVGAPWLTVVIPEAWESEDFSQMAHVSNHDGRHRMHSILEQEGNDPVEVHIIVPHMRRRHITDAMVDHLRSGVLNQQGQYVSGPVFGAAK